MNKKYAGLDIPAWFDGKDINEAAFCREFLSKNKLIYADNAFFTSDGRLTDPLLLKEKIYAELECCAARNIPRTISNIVEIMKLAAHTGSFPPKPDEIHVQNGTLRTDGSFLLPSHAPSEYADRETLWNAVEKAERGKKAQLAYSFDIALQSEFSMQENIALARQFLLENFVSRGMVVDFAVHSPDKEDVGIFNPHFHVMCPIRPLDEHGRWGNKQRREYVLDEHGERVLDEAGNYVFNAVPTTDWGKPETLEAWRQAWAEMCNAKFAEKGLDCRIDHRSFARQGVEQIPTQHEGPTVRAMEAKGIRTDKGNLNRFIWKTNALLREAKEKIAALIGWLKDVKAELAKPQPPMLNDLLALHCSIRNKGAYSNKAKNANLQRYAEAFNFLQSKNLYTVDDLETTLHSMQDKIDTLKKSASSKQARIKEVDELLRMVDYYKSGKPAADKLKSIRFEKSRQKYKAEHDDELRTFYMAERKLKSYFKDGKLPITAWRREREQLEQEYKEIQSELSPLHADAKKLWAIHYNIYEVQHEQERQNTATRQKKQEMEH